MEALNWLDLIIIGLVFVFGLKGLSSGLIREIFGIIGIIGGFVLAIRYKAEVGAWISTNIYDLGKIGVMSETGTQSVVGFIVALFGIWFAALILGELLTKLLGLSGLSLIDRIGGFVFGGAKIFLIFAVLAVFIRSSAFLNDQARPYFENSITYPYLVNVGTKLMGMRKEDIIPTTQKRSNEEKNSVNVVYEKSEVTQDNNQTLDLNISTDGFKNEN
ncbi:CvpA family protein [Campylobacter corcagiensis]|uniref:CvpA family protein n=1 Tax=Campylobacter corcagiensis TaxID=1448857 RepID=A0A7M1LH48_9BACT|nr:CvpA family protein [Campylobacter corcagiensis]QKF64154.1 CvpA family membrane protein [Campylobacter corcagiensis]QOQ87651.1 CvpA family protein [Campylobacter corcagiensis]